MNNDLTASLLRATLESTADGILVVTRDRNAPIYNQKFLQMWGAPEHLMQPGFADERLIFLAEQTVDPASFLTRVWELFRDRPEETALELLELKDGRVFERYSQPLQEQDQIIGRVWSFRDITERRRNEQALKRQAIAIQTSIDGIAILDSRHHLIYLNESYAQIYGYDSATELIGQSWKQLYDPVEQHRIDQEILPELHHTGCWHGEAVGTQREGRLFPQEMSLSVIEGGELVCVVRDITARTQAEVALRQAEGRYRSIFENAVVGIYQTTADGSYLSVNPTLAQMHGYDSPVDMMATLTNIPQQLYVSAERREEFKRCLIENDTVSNFEAQVYRKDGSIIWVSENARTVKDAAGSVLYYEGSSIEITQRKRAETALQRSEWKYRTLFENSQVGIYRIRSEDGLIVEANQRAVELIGYDSPAAIVGKKYTREFYADLSLRPQLLEKIRQDGGLDNLELQFRRQDGSIRWGLFTLQVNLEENVLEAVVTDITDRKRLELALQDSQNKLNDVLNSAIAAICSMRLNPTGEWDYVYCSPGHGVVFGYTPEELLADRDLWLSRVYPEDVDSIVIPKQQRALVEPITKTEFRFYHRNGCLRWISETATSRYDTAEQCWIVTLFSTDITEQKLVEEALQRNNALLQAQQEAAIDGILAIDENQKIMSYNHRFGEIWQIPEAVIQSSDDTHLLTWVLSQIEQPEAFLARVQHLYDHPHESSQDEIVLKDGRTLDRYSASIWSTTGEYYGRVWYFRDISDRKQAEAALRRSEERLRLTLALTRIGTWEWQPDTGILSGSDNSTRLLGLLPGESEFNTQTWRAGVHPHDLEYAQQAIYRALETQADFEVEYRVIYPDGSIHWVADRGRGTPNQEGQITRMLGVMIDITERKQAEEALRRSEAKYRHLFENSQVGIGRTRLEDGVFLEVNQRYAEIMGFDSPADLVGTSFTDAFYANPSDRNHLRALLDQSNEIRNFEEQLRRPDGSTAWGLLSLRLNLEEGCLDFVIADISDRKRLEEELRQSQQFLDSIINNIPLALYAKDIRNDFRYVLINQNADRVLGFNRDIAINRNDHDLLPPELADRYRQQDETAVRSGTLLEIPEQPIQGDDDVIIARSLKLPLYDSQGHPTHLLCISEDVTEQKRQQEALRLIVEGTASTTGDDFFHACVRYLAEVLRVRYTLVSEHRQEMGDRVRILAAWSGDTFGKPIEYAIAGSPCEEVFQGRICYYPSDLQRLFPDDADLVSMGAESYLGVPLTNAAGVVLGHLAVMDTQPMSADPGRELILRIFAARAGAELERQQAEKSLRVAKDAAETANRAKSTFLANMSHELRTPLNAILGFAQLMERDSTLEPRQRGFLEIINRSGEHLLNLINDVLEMSKIEAGRIVLNPVPFDLHQLLQTLHEIFQLRADSKRLSLQFAIAPDLPRYILADEGKLRQVLINLLSNAIKFTQTGHVSLQASLATEPLLTSITPTELIPLHFEVADTGCGIAVEEMDRLFQPFVQTTSGTLFREGTGLGLAISRQFVQLMGGDIYFTSTLGRGSTFCFEVQVSPVNPTHVLPNFPQKRVLELAPNQPSYRILVVDDLLENRDLIAQLLRTVGFEIRTAENGQDAIAQWHTWHPHLIWMDIRMPVLNGYDATRQIRDIESRALVCPENRTKIIALTASAFDDQQASILAAGCDDLVLKPFREQTIFEKMAEHLGVTYLYEELEQPAAAVVAPPSLAPKISLHTMPTAWLYQLRAAALAVDAEPIHQLIQQIPQQEMVLAARLTELVHNYDFDEILDWIDSKD